MRPTELTPNPQQTTPTPRHYWLIVASDGFPIDSFEDEATATRFLLGKHHGKHYRIIKVQEVPNE